jgi:phage-related holin
MYCVVKTSHVWCVIVYRQFHNYDGVIFFYIVMFLIQITVCRSIPRHFCSDLSIFDGPDFAGRIPFLTFPFLLPTE